MLPQGKIYQLKEEVEGSSLLKILELGSQDSRDSIPRDVLLELGNGLGSSHCPLETLRLINLDFAGGGMDGAVQVMEACKNRSSLTCIDITGVRLESTYTASRGT